MSPPKCHKKRYRDRLAAKIALSQIRTKDRDRPKSESRIYRCERCFGWHLTSVALR